ncbi:MAG TPA: carboxypeptidase-like regulatory domain-containing protein [Panacibacter sp.]|nr:carboxypeptidase-like regulatory domain-containing protein [Panacibacter sp.]
MATLPKPKYPCTQQQLYEVTRTGWSNFQEFLTFFADFKGYYKQTYADDALTKLAAAENLPDDQSRYAEAETQRIQLTKTADNALDLWQRLKSYITDAFKDGFEKPQIEAAGAAYYTKAANYGWEQLKSLLNAAVIFINANEAALLLNDNMPATFKPKVITAQQDVETQYKNFLSLQQAAESATVAKINANNEVYDKLIAMFTDGQLIFKSDADKKSRFVFDSLLSYITTAGPSGLRITVKESITELPVSVAAVTIQPGNLQAVTDVNGVVEINLATNAYSISITKSGYKDYNETGVDVTTGIMSRKNITMEKS